MNRLLVLGATIALLASSCGSVTTTEPTPTPTASASSIPSASPSPSATPRALDHDVVYFARDRLPPVAGHIDAAGQGSTPEARVLARLKALFSATAPAGLFNTTASVKARPRAVTISGDTATVDFDVPGGDWGTAGSAGTRAFIQQLIYTASEEPGVRRVLLLENGGPAVVGGEGVVIDHAAAREDVAGYSFKASTDPMTLGADRSAPLGVQAGLVLHDAANASTQLVITADGATPKDLLGFTLAWKANDESTAPELGKWALVVDVPKATQATTGTSIVDATPVRAMRSTARGDAMRYEIGFDDLRPWRVAMLYAPLRLVVEVGGDPQATSPNIALASPTFGKAVRAGDPVTGLIRAFEARFEYRVSDARGNVVVDDFATASLGTSELWGAFQIPFPKVPAGTATLEILLRTPRDGSITETVSTSIEVAATP